MAKTVANTVFVQDRASAAKRLHERLAITVEAATEWLNEVQFSKTIRRPDADMVHSVATQMHALRRSKTVLPPRAIFAPLSDPNFDLQWEEMIAQGAKSVIVGGMYVEFFFVFFFFFCFFNFCFYFCLVVDCFLLLIVSCY